MNKELIYQRFHKSIGTYDEESFVQQGIAKHLASLINGQPLPSCCDCLEIGCGTGHLTRALHHTCNISHYTLNDICEQVKPYFVFLPEVRKTFHIGDAEHLDFGKRYGLIASASSLQWFDDPLGFLVRCKDYLLPEGIAGVSLFGVSNMKEVTDFTGIALPYPWMQQINSELGKSFELLHLEETSIVHWFDSPLDVLHHLKRTGVTGICNYQWNKTTLQAFQAYYRQNYEGKDGRVRLTYHPIYILMKTKK